MTERRRVDEWANELERFEPGEQRAADTRDRLLDEVASTPPQRPWRTRGVVAAAIVVAVILTGWIAARNRGESTIADNTPAPTLTEVPIATPASLAAIRPQPDAVFQHVERGSTERVRLIDGSVDFKVEKLDNEERFLVLVGQAEVEVRGTHFEVVATDDRLEDVIVTEGLVEVRADGRTVNVAAGQRWSQLISTPAPSRVRHHLINPGWSGVISIGSSLCRMRSPRRRSDASSGRRQSLRPTPLHPDRARESVEAKWPEAAPRN